MSEIFQTYLTPSTCPSQKVDAIYSSEIPLSSSYLSSNYSLLSLSFPVPIPSLSVPSLCSSLAQKTLYNLTDPYYSSLPHQSLLNPYTLGFFKTNIPSHPYNFVKFDEKTYTRAETAVLLSGSLRTFATISSNIISRLEGGVNDFAVYEYLRGKNVRVTVWDMEFVIVRENGPRCGSVSKVRNVVCQVVGGFEVFGREGFGADECADYFNYIGREDCKEAFKDIYGGRISEEDNDGEHYKSLERRMAENPEWFNVFRDHMADYDGAEGGGGEFWERDQQWYPLIIEDYGNEQREVGYVGLGYVVTENLIKALRKALKCEAQQARLKGKLSLTKTEREERGCKIEEVLLALEEGQVGEGLDCIGSCDEKKEKDALLQRINERAVELVGEVEKRTNGEEL
ncbi:hypothetical protein TrST_g9542 [Triparma strigata]|nr:hypothetical protein TrST_g9542 [Triparma strigata]